MRVFNAMQLKAGAKKEGGHVSSSLTQPIQFFPGTKIIIPDAAKEEDYKGHVVGVGPDVEKTINVGDLVQYADYATPTVMKHMGEDHLLIAAGDIFAVIVNE